MSEFSGELIRDKRWENLLSQRPRLIVEVGSSGTGALAFKDIREAFKNGKYRDTRYLGIDDDPNISLLKVHGDFVEVECSRLVGSNVTRSLAGQADEIWIRNMGSLAKKSKEFKTEILQLIKKDGQVIFFDDYSYAKSLRDVEAEVREREEFSSDDGYGFAVENFSKKLEELNHPMVKSSMSDPARTTVFRLKKRVVKGD